ncbi:MAG: HipA domain-containing protein [Myxococcales bacterium]|nr:HipA domain-containing protein [Myxococcales bacterium]
MSGACLACLRPSEAGHGGYHRACLRALFETDVVPAIDIELAKLHTVGLAMAGKTSLSGVQRKVSLGLSTERTTLQVSIAPGRFILKPRAETFAELPENELTTMRLAAEVGLEVPPCALVTLKDGSTAYIVRRFDRAADHKVHQEDFCQLAQKSPKEKYDGSAELCVRVVRRYASEPGIEMLKLYRQLVFAWWTGNGDMHLKNLSMLRDDDGLIRMTPAYDLISTRLHIPEDDLALPIGGKRGGVTRRTWRELADYAGIPRKAADRVLEDIAGRKDACTALIDRSPLSPPLREAYRALLEDRTAALVGHSPS